MIMRIFQVTTRPGKEAEFSKFFHETAIPLMKGTDGIEDITFCLPGESTPNEFATVMIWRDLEALKAFVGDDYQTPHIHPDEAGIVKNRFLHHYELLPT